jgi:predicted ABC-type transport system involved in lysophospholipase L1 biosynthesis ATPase subunit
MAYVPDEPFLYEKLTGREFLRFVAGLYGIERPEAESRIGQLAEKFDFAGYMDELCEGYSHGMSQRIVIGSALIHDPQVLLIDEPFVGLDPRSARTLKDTFREMTARGADRAGRVGVPLDAHARARRGARRAHRRHPPRQHAGVRNARADRREGAGPRGDIPGDDRGGVAAVGAVSGRAPRRYVP